MSFFDIPETSDGFTNPFSVSISVHPMTITPFVKNFIPNTSPPGYGLTSGSISVLTFFTGTTPKSFAVNV